MTENGKRSVSVGQANVKHHGADVEIMTVAQNEKEVFVRYPFAHKRNAWVRVEDLTFQDDLSTSPNTSPNPQLYPVGTVLTNAAGESVQVVDRFKQDVKLQLLVPTPTLSAGREGEVGGALVTDFQPSDDEPFTMTEDDVTEWLAKTTPSAAADTTPLSLPLHTWEVGQRARLLEDLPHDFQPLKEGDEGIVVKLGTGVGFKPDGLRAAVSYRSLNGKTVFVLDHCEFVVDGSPAQPEATTTDTPETGDSALELELKALRGENKRLSEIIDSQRLDLTLLQRALDAAKTDDNTTLIEDNGKLKAALMDAEKRNQRLEADKARLEQTNPKQSEMLRGAAMPQSVARPEPTAHLKTIMTHGGSNGFANAEIPHGYQIVAVTTEVYDGKLTRLTHMFGCGNSPTPPETLAEKVTVEFEKPQNSFEDLLRGNAPAEEVIAVGNAEVMAAARQAAEARLRDYVPTEMPLLEGVK